MLNDEGIDPSSGKITIKAALMYLYFSCMIMIFGLDVGFIERGSFINSSLS